MRQSEAGESGCVFGRCLLPVTPKPSASVFLLTRSGNTLYLIHFMVSSHGDSDIAFFFLM